MTIEDLNKIERAHFKRYNDAIDATLPLRDVWYKSLQELRNAIEKENEDKKFVEMLKSRTFQGGY